MRLSVGWSLRTVGFTLPLLAGALALSSCATLSKEQCVMGNWQAIGYNDGVAGYSSERLASHTKACAKANISPDYQAWERGRQQGLKQYCTPSNAYAVGRKGQQLNSVCPSAMLPELRSSYTQGYNYYKLNAQLQADQQQLQSYLTEYDKLREGEQLDFKTEKEARARLLSLQPKIRSLRRDINNMEAQLDSLNRQLKY